MPELELMPVTWNMLDDRQISQETFFNIQHSSKVFSDYTTACSQIIFNAMPDQYREDDDIIGGSHQNNVLANRDTKISTKNKLKNIFGKRKIKINDQNNIKSIFEDVKPTSA